MAPYVEDNSIARLTRFLDQPTNSPDTLAIAIDCGRRLIQARRDNRLPTDDIELQTVKMEAACAQLDTECRLIRMRQHKATLFDQLDALIKAQGPVDAYLHLWNRFAVRRVILVATGGTADEWTHLLNDMTQLQQRLARAA